MTSLLEELQLGNKRNFKTTCRQRAKEKVNNIEIEMRERGKERMLEKFLTGSMLYKKACLLIIFES